MEAARFARVRDARSAETAEDYVEAIADLIAERGQCRVTDLAAWFGVSHVTVSRTIGRLADRQPPLVRTERHKPVELTIAGRRLAARAKTRHQTCVRFLIALGLDRATAETDAEGIEHHVSAHTLRLFRRFADERGA
ncbi:MAG: manganese-binding transcriptional regulator MntR [Phycisphaerales bacterium]|nr:manganese-binding transcriptional regulator MntR [Phycisphaerales bacterium]